MNEENKEILIETPVNNNPIKISIRQKIRWYFKRLLIDIKDAFKFFMTRRYFKNNIPILVMTEIKNFNKPEMYISPDVVKIIKRFKLDPETLDNYSDDGKGTASIAFSPKTQKWYGWSHRAIYGFKIGDVVETGNLIATWEYHTLPVGFKAETLDDCRRMAIAFADSVN